MGNCNALPTINCVNSAPVTTYVHAALVGSPAITQLTPLSFGGAPGPALFEACQ